MINEIIGRLGKENLERIAVENHVAIKNAVYVLLDVGMQYKIMTAEEFSKNQEYKEIDYFSQIINTNKSVDKKKKITSNNKYTFFCRHLDRLTDEIIDQYFASTDPNGENKVFAEWVKENYSNFEKDKMDYLKIFYLKDIEDCISDGKSYFLENSVSKSPNKAPDGYGIGIFYTANLKKPYIGRKSLKYPDGDLVDKETAYDHLCVYNILKEFLRSGKQIIYVTNDIHGYSIFSDVPPKMMDAIILVIGFDNRGNVRIYDYEHIPMYTPELRDSKHTNGVILENYIRIPNEELSNVKYNDEIADRNKLEKLFNSYFFDGKLIPSYISDVKTDDQYIRENISKYQSVYFDYFWKNSNHQIIKAIDNSTLDIIKGNAFDRNISKAQRQFNLRWSVLEYLDGRNTGNMFDTAYMTLRYHINLDKYEEWDFSDDNEYNIAVGAAVRYLLDLDKAVLSNEYYLKGILSAKNTAMIKKKILVLYQKVNYKMLHVDGGRIQQILSHIMEEDRFKVNKEMILAGYVAELLIYEQK